jgi:hypothetical protein
MARNVYATFPLFARKGSHDSLKRVPTEPTNKFSYRTALDPSYRITLECDNHKREYHDLYGAVILI